MDLNIFILFHKIEAFTKQAIFLISDLLMARQPCDKAASLFFMTVWYENGLLIFFHKFFRITPDKFEYSKSATINAITKVESDKLTLMDVLINDHSSDVDCCTFKVKSDGYYVIDHIVLPTIKWLHSTEFLAEYDVIYVTDLDKIYKSTDGVDLEECTIKEVIERNPEGTTIQHCKVDLVYTGNL